MVNPVTFIGTYPSSVSGSLLMLAGNVGIFSVKLQVHVG